MLALRDYLNKSGKYVAVYANVETGQSARNDVGRAVGAVCNEIAVRFKDTLKSDDPVKILKSFKDTEPDSKLNLFLRQLTGICSLPVVLFIDEIDALVGDSLVSVLRQLRSGYDDRPESFPQSIILCGVRDVRDYRIVLSNQDIITGGSAFNIKAKSLRIGDFSIEEIRELYNQHTEETGQKFEEGCFPLIWSATEGQPWLVNAIGHEVTYEMKENRERSVIIIPEVVEKAIESIIYRRDTHIDILIDKLKEERVRRVIEPLLAGKDEVEDNLIPEDDIRYVQDLGLIKIERGKTRRISNAIYKEIIPRELTWTTQDGITQDPVWYIKEDRSIDMTKNC